MAIKGVKMNLDNVKWGYLTHKDKKKALKGTEADRFIRDYLKAAHADIMSGCDTAIKLYKIDTLDADTYAAKIEMKNSGNEPRVYAWVLDNKGNVLFVADYLQDTPDAYARTAAVCGAFLDAFNCYMFLNA